MKNRLPKNPLESLKISLALRIVLIFFHVLADIFRFWRYPRIKAAAEFENMSLLDKIYWTYKSKKPVIRPEKKLSGVKFHLSTVCRQKGELKTENSVTLSAVGDLIKIPGIEKSKDLLYSDISENIFEKEISIANLESHICDADTADIKFNSKTAPSLYCSKLQYRTLVSHKNYQFTVLNTACNHSLDMGIKGLKTTLNELENNCIINIGTSLNPTQKNRGVIIQKNNIKIGFISATFGINGKPIPPGYENCIHILPLHRPERESHSHILETQISSCRKKNCDFIIAILHWGYEYEFFPRFKQVEFAHELIENGVDMILSHHSHVLQPYEFYTCPHNPHKSRLITYSLGNLTYPFSDPALVLSCVLNFTINKGRMNGKKDIYTDDIRFIPVVQICTEHKNRNIIQIKKLSDIIKNSRQLKNRRIRKLCSYADLVFGADWRNN